MGQSSGWFLPRQIHRLFAGRLRLPFFTVFGVGKFAASVLASWLPRSVCTWLRLLRASGFIGQAPAIRLWHHLLPVRCSKQAAPARLVIPRPMLPNNSFKPNNNRYAIVVGLTPVLYVGWRSVVLRGFAHFSPGCSLAGAWHSPFLLHGVRAAAHAEG